MIADLEPYPEYKESGLPWLGQVPGHWEKMRLKRVLRPVDHRSSTGAETLLSLRRDHGIVVYADHFSRPPQGVTTVGFKRVRVGQLVVNRMQANNGLVFRSRLDGLVSPDYSVFEARVPLQMDYLSELLRTPLYRAHFRRESTGLGTGSAGFLRLYDDRLLNTTIAIPSFSEQVVVLRFLGWANRRLERAIRAKRQVIALLNEQKQAIIHRAVTRGLDPTVRLRPSGIPWLGDIPQHWKTLRAKYLYREVDERSADGRQELLSVSHLTGVTPRSQKNITMFKAASYAGHKLCRPGDLVVNTMWAWMGAFGISPLSGIVSPAYAVYRPNRPAFTVGSYMDGLLRSRPYVANIICRSTGLRLSRLRPYPEEFFRLPIIQPPLQEQQQIAETIRAETADLNTGITRVEREVVLLREYRTRLVADVVTGKLDVREAAVQLPEGAAPDLAEERNELDFVDDEDSIAAEAEG